MYARICFACSSERFARATEPHRRWCLSFAKVKTSSLNQKTPDAEVGVIVADVVVQLSRSDLATVSLRNRVRATTLSPNSHTPIKIERSAINNIRVGATKDRATNGPPKSKTDVPPLGHKITPAKTVARNEYQRRAQFTPATRTLLGRSALPETACLPTRHPQELFELFDMNPKETGIHLPKYWAVS
tara:strand:- start:2466 stop:3026 length:561 start_codon:yes stop_codon:yes gene_type:complete